MAREIKEEIGYSSHLGRLIGTYSMFLLGVSKPIYYELVGSFYECQIINYIASETEPDHELIWMEPVKASEMMQLEYQAYAIRVYMELSRSIDYITKEVNDLTKDQIDKLNN